MKHYVGYLASIVGGIFAACDSSSGGGGSGKVQVFVEPEDTIPEGLEPGTDEEQVVDGWTVTYDKFLAVVGDFRASRSAAPSDKLGDGKFFVVDLKNTPTDGLVIATFDDVDAVRWDRVGYTIGKAKAGYEKAPGISQSDYDLMVNNGYSLYVTGHITKSDGQSCKPTAPTDCVAAPSVAFTFPLKLGTSFDDCASEEGDAGFAVPSGGTVQVKPTIHGDHWFFTNITQGAEITDRRAQWIANADLDRDGSVDPDELALSRASDLFPAAQYNLSGAIIPVATGRDYLEAQARTLGDFNGEGECPTRAILP